MSGITKKVEHAATRTDLKVLVESALKDAIADPTMADMTLDRGAIEMLVEMLSDSKSEIEELKHKIAFTYGNLGKAPNLAAMAINETLFAGLHPASVSLVTSFGAAIGKKLLGAQEKYGYAAEWLQWHWADKCRADLMEHVRKGDPLDVAAYAAFCWFHGWSTAPASDAKDPSEVLDRIKSHITGYYAALDMRKHGGIAETQAFRDIESELGMRWVRGATLEKKQ